MNAWDLAVGWGTGVEPAHPVAVFRIVLGLLVLLQAVVIHRDLDLLYGPDGLVPDDVYRDFAMPRVSVFRWMTSPAAHRWVFWAVVVSAGCLTVGLLPSLAALVCWLFFRSLVWRNVFASGGPEAAFSRFLLLTVLVDSGAAWSLHNPLADAVVRSWPVDLLRLQVASIIFFTAVNKLRGTGWLRGEALHGLFSVRLSSLHHASVRTPLPWPRLLDRPWVYRWMGRVVVVAQLALPWLLWWDVTRAPAALVLIGVHAGIQSWLNIGLFQPLMIGALTLFLW